MELWEQVQSVNVGASYMVCKRCSSVAHPYQYDDRPYGSALAELFPHIAKWCHGHWSEETEAECLALFRYALGHRSRPMLAIGVAAVGESPEVKQRIWDALSEEEKATLRRLVRIGLRL